VRREHVTLVGLELQESLSHQSSLLYQPAKSNRSPENISNRIHYSVMRSSGRQKPTPNLGIGALEVGYDAAPPLQDLGALLRHRRYLRCLPTNPPRRYKHPPVANPHRVNSKREYGGSLENLLQIDEQGHGGYELLQGNHLPRRALAGAPITAASYLHGRCNRTPLCSPTRRVTVHRLRPWAGEWAHVTYAAY
jgi:hypothetical protein